MTALGLRPSDWVYRFWRWTRDGFRGPNPIREAREAQRLFERWLNYTLNPTNEGKPWPTRRPVCAACGRDDVPILVTQRGGGAFGMCVGCRGAPHPPTTS